VQDLELTGEMEEQPGRVRSWLANIYPVQTGTNTVRWVGAVIVDTTQRRNSEEALRKTEKLAAAGRLAASIAHEINNPLEAVTNLLYLIPLRFYRQSTLPITANISELLDSVLTLHQGRVNTLQVRVRKFYDTDVEVFCFAGEMRQLFANLISNALDAMMPGPGTLTLSVRRSHSWRDPSIRGVRISVADTGCGMAEDVRRRIFEPFFTTKEATGTGLGLWVSAEVIQKHHGEIRIRSRVLDDEHPGRQPGTIFMIFFPLLAVDEEPAENYAARSQTV
jgi:signal transduction histidine kinase